MSKIIKIDHLAILVDDLDAALDFWQAALGLQATQVSDLSRIRIVRFILSRTHRKWNTEAKQTPRNEAGKHPVNPGAQ